jgi:CAAX protease family protein
MMRSLLKFFSLTYLVSWACFFTAAALSRETASPASGLARLGSPLVLLLGVFAPALIALALAARAEGRAGALALLRRVVRTPAGVGWYVFAAGYMAAIKLAAALLQRLVTGAWPAFGQLPIYVMAVAVLFSTPVQAGEEIGWRGYALPRLAERLGLARASVVLGVIWACWHLPFFFIPGSDNSGQSFPVFLLSVTALSVAMAWLYWRTHGSLLLTMLMHAAVNNTTGIVPSPASVAHPFSLNAPLVGWLTAALLWIGAATFLVRMRGSSSGADALAA